MPRRTRTRRNSGIRKIGAADIAFAQSQAPAALAYYRSRGLAEVRRRAIRLVLTGLVPVLGLLWLGWSPLTMLLFLLADVLITLVADWVRYPIARRWIAASHARDHAAGEVMLIIDGLDDGSGERPDRGRSAPYPGLILGIGTVCSVFLIPIMLASVEKIGLPAARAVLDDAWWLPLVAADAVLTIGGSLLAALAIRRAPVGEGLLFMESGSIGVLYAGLLLLVWLPLKFGMSGLLALFVILHGTRLAFGVFALYWMPGAVRRIAARLDAGDFALRAR